MENCHLARRCEMAFFQLAPVQTEIGPIATWFETHRNCLRAAASAVFRSAIFISYRLHQKVYQNVFIIRRSGSVEIDGFINRIRLIPAPFVAQSIPAYFRSIDFVRTLTNRFRMILDHSISVQSGSLDVG